jgi:hypothetical protein
VCSIVIVQAAQLEQVDSRILNLLSICAGDEAALIATGCSWVELVIAHLLYVDPLAQRAHIPQITKRYIGNRPVSSLPVYQRVLYAVCCDEIVLALRLSAEVCEPWFPAHLVDLLCVGGVCVSDMNNAREIIVGSHVDVLASVHDMWLLCLGYLCELGSWGIARMNVLVSHIDPPTEAAAIRLYYGETIA